MKKLIKKFAEKQKGVFCSRTGIVPICKVNSHFLSKLFEVCFRTMV